MNLSLHSQTSKMHFLENLKVCHTAWVCMSAKTVYTQKLDRKPVGGMSFQSEWQITAQGLPYDDTATKSVLHPVSSLGRCRFDLLLTAQWKNNPNWCDIDMADKDKLWAWSLHILVECSKIEAVFVPPGWRKRSNENWWCSGTIKNWKKCPCESHKNKIAFCHMHRHKCVHVCVCVKSSN